MPQEFFISPLGDNAVILSFGNVLNEETNCKVLQLFHHLKESSHRFIDMVPAYSSLTVYYDASTLHTSGKTAFEQVKESLIALVQEEQHQSVIKGKNVRIPVCYAPMFAPDLEELAFGKNLSVEEIIRLHTSKTYRVYMIGFLPGFPYMGSVDERIATPRRSSPRTSIPAGSVGIAGLQTGIYPFASPGGWNIIGRTPIRLFDKQKKEPVLLQPGDMVTFYSITEDEFEDYQKRTA
jgi:inhibitor of KinA